MTRDQLWKIYTDKNPQFLDTGSVTMSCESLKKFFDQTWEQAAKSANTDPSTFLDNYFKTKR